MRNQILLKLGYSMQVLVGFFFAIQAHGGISGSLDAGTGICGGAPVDCERWAISAELGKDDTKLLLLSNSPDSSCSVRAGYEWTPMLASFEVKKAQLHAGNSVGRMNVNAEPKWLNYGIWSLDGSSILAADGPRKSIFHFSLDAESISQISISDSKSGQQAQPARLQVLGDKYIVEADGSMVVFDRSYALLKRVAVFGKGSKDRGFIRSFVAWVPLDTGEIIGFGDISSESVGTGGRWFAAIFRFSLDKPESFTIIHSMELENNSRQLARFFPILARAGSKAYMLIAEGELAIYEVGTALRRLSAFPRDYQTFFNVPFKILVPEIPGLYRLLEQSQAVTGLYGRGDHLFLLARRPGATNSDGIDWRIFKIDPVHDKIVDEIPLDSREPHLFLVPGDKAWAIVEKGRVEKAWEQNVTSIVQIPSAQIESSGLVLHKVAVADEQNRPDAPSEFAVRAQGPDGNRLLTPYERP
jgi:hypothetical protein